MILPITVLSPVQGTVHSIQTLIIGGGIAGASLACALAEREAGAGTAIVDIDAFALQNCFELNYDPDPGQTVALLNIGASVMNINIVRGGIPLFTRDVSVGGNQYTDALQKELGAGAAAR